MSPVAAAPAEPFVVLQAETHGLPDIWIINTALEELADRGAFPWHLSIMVEMNETFANGIPTRAEQVVLGEFGDAMGARLKEDGNALWVANVTWNGTRQFVYRVRDPEIAHEHLSSVVQSDAAIRPLEYEMEEDADWGHATTYLENARNARDGMPLV